MNSARILFAVLFLFALGFFFRNAYRLLALLCLGRWENRFDRLADRFKDMMVYAFGQRRVLKSPFGINHFIIFWGFLVLLPMNAEFLVAGIFPQFSLSFVGTIPYGAARAATDVMSLVVLVAVAVATTRRLFFRPAHIEATWDAFFILGMIAALMVAYFGYHAGAIRLGETEWRAWMPVANAVSGLVARQPETQVRFWAEACWWLHAGVLLLFLNYLPYSKHLHILAAIPNCFLRSADFVKTVPRLKFERGLEFGHSQVTHFTWKDLLDFMACTECGRCQAACPASATGKILNPKEIILRGKHNLFANGAQIMARRRFDTLGPAPEDTSLGAPLIGGDPHLSVSEEALWQCTTCGACMQECPVLIEHVPKIIAMRRHLAMEQAKFPEELLGFFVNSEQRFNPWGVAPADRAKWMQDLNIPTAAQLAQAGKPIDYLYFVGCSGAFDPRSRSIVVAMVKILNAAGVSWAVLGQEEKCCGDSLRRLGNEYVFEDLAKENMRIFEKYNIRRMVTHCPHGFSTLLNDYKQYAAEFEVLHHSELISQLIQDGRLKLRRKVDGVTVFHDPCYLGRYNNVYEPPRKVLIAAAGGVKPREMKRCRERSFCCGAGGGRMWLEEPAGRRIYLERTREALRDNPSTIAVACPFCMSMFENGLKDEGKENNVRVKDIAEIIADAL